MLRISLTYKNEKPSRFLTALFILILTALFFSCSGQYGSLKRDPAVTDAFDSNTVNREYQYFYYGRSNQPYIIVGIDPTYHMRSVMWREVDPDSEAFTEMIYWIWTDVLWGYRRTKGAHILDPQGNEAGIWYSHLWWAAIRFSDDNRIEIMPDVNGLGDWVR